MLSKTFQITALIMMIPAALMSAGYCAVKPSTSLKDKPAQTISALIKKAITDGNLDVKLPAGTYIAGPNAISIPENMSIEGSGNSTVIKLADGTGSVFLPSKGSSIVRMHIDGANGKSGGVGDGIIMLNSGSSGVTIDSVTFTGSPRTCIVTDHADNTTIRNCRFTDIFQAVSIQFSKEIRILNNTVINAKNHGIQFWGNWKWDSKGCSNIFINGNYVKNVGGGAIWGTGANFVIAANNIVDGATDVGIDLEWCDDSVISGNVVSNFENGGISLFFACRGVSISGNTILNNRPITDPKAAWWARAGIWLTYPNTESYPKDNGHRDVAITGNTITCAEGDRRAIWVGSSSDNIVIGNNAIKGGGVWSGGGTTPMKQITDNVTVNF